jgi:hypothetical protein
MSASERENLPSNLQAARQAALAHVPEQIRSRLVFRECVCWPLQESHSELDARALREAIAASLGPIRESVFSFLRYFDYAQWNADRGALCMASEQRDRYLPLYVYWEVTPSDVLFQHSSQPDYVGSDLSVTETARYVADAIDSAGQLYEKLGVTGEVEMEIQVTGVSGRRVEGSSALCTNTYLKWSASRAPSEWIAQRKSLAQTSARALLAQSDPHLDLDGAISKVLRAEFHHLDARRVLTP